MSVEAVDEGVQFLGLNMDEVHVESMPHRYHQHQADYQVVLVRVCQGGTEDELGLHDQNHSCEADNCQEEVSLVQGLLNGGRIALYAKASMKKLKMGAMLKTVVEVLTGMYLTQKKNRV